MNKPNLTNQELKALYPPMSEAFDKKVQNTLSQLEHEREQPKVKKKMSATLVFAVVLILVTLSAAIALTQSDLLKSMFGGDTQVPEELEDVVSKPEATVSTADVAVTLNEYLYDGEKLHLSWNVSDISGRQVMVTMSRFQINGKYVNIEDETLFQSPDHALAHVLGGEADGVAIPASVSNFGTYSNQQFNYPIKQGETVEITCDLYVWEVLNSPVMINDSLQITEDDFIKVKGLHRLPVDRNGLCILDQFVLDDGTIDAETGEDYRHAFEKLGWAKMTTIQPVKFTITLEPKKVKKVEPTQTCYETDDFFMVISRMVYMQTGGTLELKVYPKTDKETNENNPFFRDLVVLNADTMEFLNSGRNYGTSEDNSIDYQITLEPVSGKMPSSILIAPSVMKDKWDSAAEHDPKKDRYYNYTLDDAVRVELN